MRNKAFSLAELSVVLVIIGLILVFIVRSSNLGATARELHDVATLNKLRNAFTTEYGRTLVFPEIASEGAAYFYDMDYFYYDNITTEKELASKVVKGTHWALMMCSDRLTTLPENRYYNLSKNPGNYVCAATVKGNNIIVSDRLTCVLERDLDNSDISTGYGRSVPERTDSFEYDDCRSYSISQDNASDKEYVFRIF